MNYLPLAGLTIIDFSWIGAGSYTTRILADLGADVIKIESSKSLDSLRLASPYKGGIKGLNRSGYFADRNSSKQGITVNLKHPKGLEVVHQLIRNCDAVANNFTPGTMDRLGLGHEALLRINPRLIYLSMSMNGDEGPERDMLGYGITISAVTGLLSFSGEPGRPPVGTGTNFPDHVPNPCHAAFALLAAVRNQRRTGKGQSIDIAQTEPMLALMPAAFMSYEANGCVVERRGNRIPGHAPRGVYPTYGVDRWIAVSVRTDVEWGALVDILGRATLDRPSWQSATQRESDQESIDKCLSALTPSWIAEDLMKKLQARGVPAGVVQSSADLVDRDPQLKHREHWRFLDHSEMGGSIYNALPFQFESGKVGPRYAAPLLGEHTYEVCRERLGMTDEEIAQLIKEDALV